MKHGKICKNDVVVLPFPFSDLSATKRRPALIVAELSGDDFILCQITSITRKDGYSIILENKDFYKGKLGNDSTIRPNRLFTADKSISLYKVGAIKTNKSKIVEDVIVNIFRK